MPDIITGIVALMLLALEEILFQSMIKRGVIRRTFSSEEARSPGEIRGSKTLERVRLFQLITLTVMLVFLDTTTPRLLLQVPGQLAMTATALQLIRMLGRQVLRHWSVLGEIQIFQAFFLMLSLFRLRMAVSASPASNWFTLLSLSMVFFRALNATALAFSVTYAVRALLPEGSPLFRSNPPMAFSDYWAGRTCSASIPFALAALATMFLGGIGENAFRLHLAVSVFLVIITWAVFKTRKPHHPAAHVLTAVSALSLLYSTLSGFPID